MSFEAINSVTAAEQEAKAAVAAAEAKAKQLLQDAENAGKAEIEAARLKADGELQELRRRADEKYAAEAEELRGVMEDRKARGARLSCALRPSRSWRKRRRSLWKG